MRARTRLLKTLQDLFGAFQHPVEGLGNHGQRTDRMPLGNAMVRHEDSLRNRDANGRLCPYQHTKLLRRLLSQSPSPQMPVIWVNSGYASRRNRGIFTEITRIEQDIFTQF